MYVRSTTQRLILLNFLLRPNCNWVVTIPELFREKGNVLYWLRNVNTVTKELLSLLKTETKQIFLKRCVHENTAGAV